MQHGFACKQDAQADETVVAQLLYAAVFFDFFADFYVCVFVMFGVGGGHGVSFVLVGLGFQAALDAV